MLFNSFNFLIFFPVVTLLYFALPHNFRWFLLLAASCLFYMFFIPQYILILLFTIVIDYFAGILLENESDNRKKKIWLIVSIVANVGVLMFFKYFNFFVDNVNTVAKFFDWNYSVDTLKIVLPIGLSFHTFQAMSYTIEVYRGNQKAERHFGIYSLYVMYYPQLVAGPIERPQNLLWQFHKIHYFNYSNVTNGLKQMTWGLLKKVVIADRLSEFVNPVFDNPHAYQGISMVIAVVFFSFQIYCDFSGYSDIAIGASRVMGIDLMKNFDKPYLSTSISEFWKRWHISLSTWFKDYLYIPLGGNRRGKLRNYVNLLIVFLVSGFWHGASWTFVIWGALHGVYLLVGNFTSVIRDKVDNLIFGEKTIWLKNNLKRIVVFFLVSFAWIFFRAKNAEDAIYICTNYITGIPDYFNSLSKPGYLWLEPIMMDRFVKVVWFEYLIIFCFIFILIGSEFYLYRRSAFEWLTGRKFIIRWLIYFGFALSVLFLGVYHKDSEFIYFQF